jgi:hypothetical protein
MAALVFVAALALIPVLCGLTSLGWARRMSPPPTTQQVVVVQQPRRRWL